MTRLLEDLLRWSGMSLRQAAKAMGVNEEGIRQYTKGRRSNPRVKWLLNFANLCGFEVVIRRKGER
jgi:transcriptional regulator with XRE-family HTH domain